MSIIFDSNAKRYCLECLDIHFSADVLPSKPENNILTLHVRAVSTNYVCDSLET
jgi:hypothetical protein